MYSTYHGNAFPFFLLLCISLGLLYAFHLYLGWLYRTSSLIDKAVLIRTMARKGTTNGIERTDSFNCPNAARARLLELKKKNSATRCMLTREESVWFVYSGPQLEIEPDEEGDVTYHFFEDSAPSFRLKNDRDQPTNTQWVTLREDAALFLQHIESIRRFSDFHAAVQWLHKYDRDKVLLVQNRLPYDSAWYAVVVRHSIPQSIDDKSNGWVIQRQMDK